MNNTFLLHFGVVKNGCNVVFLLLNVGCSPVSFDFTVC